MEGLPRRSQSLREAKLQRLGRLQETFSQIATVCNYNNNILHCVSIHQPMSTELLCMNNILYYCYEVVRITRALGGVLDIALPCNQSNVVVNLYSAAVKRK